MRANTNRFANPARQHLPGLPPPLTLFPSTSPQASRPSARRPPLAVRAGAASGPLSRREWGAGKPVDNPQTPPKARRPSRRATRRQHRRTPKRANRKKEQLVGKNRFLQSRQRQAPTRCREEMRVETPVSSQSPPETPDTSKNPPPTRSPPLCPFRTKTQSAAPRRKSRPPLPPREPKRPERPRPPAPKSENGAPFKYPGLPLLAPRRPPWENAGNARTNKETFNQKKVRQTTRPQEKSGRVRYAHL